ncbi:MAG: hypothetical protein Q9N26_08300 [Aquificota bacterium]|nr:hypothetical protein [Aquificota bacterium]
MDRDLGSLLSRLERVKAIHSLLVHTLLSGSRDVYVDECDLDDILADLLKLEAVSMETADLILSIHRDFHECIAGSDNPDPKRVQVLYLRLNELIDSLKNSLEDIN